MNNELLSKANNDDFDQTYLNKEPSYVEQYKQNISAQRTKNSQTSRPSILSWRDYKQMRIGITKPISNRPSTSYIPGKRTSSMVKKSSKLNDLCFSYESTRISRLKKMYSTTMSTNKIRSRLSNGETSPSKSVSLKDLNKENSRTFMESISRDMSDINSKLYQNNYNNVQNILNSLSYFKNEYYPKEIEDRLFRIEILEKNIKKLKEYIRIYNLSKVKFCVENTKLERLIEYLKNSYDRYDERNIEIENLVSENMKLTTKIQLIKEEGKKIKEKIASEKENLSKMKEEVGKLNKKNTDLINDKKSIPYIVLTFKKHCDNLKSKIKKTINSDSAFMLNMADIMGGVEELKEQKNNRSAIKEEGKKDEVPNNGCDSNIKIANEEVNINNNENKANNFQNNEENK